MNSQNHKNKGKTKERLDNFLVEKGYFETKSQAQAAIIAGKVKINNELITKAGTQIKPDKEVEIDVKHMPYVSRGAFKLEKAVKEFNINVENKICLDVGASTGGFTDFLLQNGAAKVYAVDVGYGQLAWKLRSDDRVITIERTNIRNAAASDVYKDIDCNDKSLFAQLAVADLSFISVNKVLENVKNLMNPDQQELIILIKPQFEAGREYVPKSGVIRDKKVHFEVIKNVIDNALEMGYYPEKLTYSPIKGPAGNIEFLVYLRNSCDCGKIDHAKIENLISKVVDEAHENLKSN